MGRSESAYARYRKRRARLARWGLGYFLRTGEKTKALGLNPRSVVQAATRERIRLEGNIKPFTACCACPKCNLTVVHRFWTNLRYGQPGIIKRVCICGYVWEQRA